ncbi:MAG TPA: hemerythrin domain-containing protein [Alphaproteobacteria bacterium]
MDIFTALRHDHRHATGLLNELASGEDLSRRERADLLGELQSLMIAHNRIEETALYEALMRDPGTRDLAFRAQRQHQEAEELMVQLSGERDDDEWREKLERLRVVMERHVEEEEAVIFAAIRNSFETGQIDQVAAEMRPGGAERISEQFDEAGR